MEQNLSQQEILNKTGLNWTVSKRNLITQPIINENEETTEAGIVIPKHVALVRDDNSDVLSVMGNTYEPMQNSDLLDVLFRVSQLTGFEIAKGGLFNGGGKVFIQLKSEDLTLGNDVVMGYLTAINSFDGSTSLAFGASNLTISCQNTFFSAFRQLKNKVRHTKNMVHRVDDICRQLELVSAEEARIFSNIELLAQTDSNPRTKEMVLRKLFNIKSDVDLNDKEQISTRTRNAIDVYKVDARTERDDKGDNMWGLFSGVTKYTTHSVNKNRKGGYDSNEKMYNFYGKREQAIFHELVDLSNISSN
jgi:phage/plasmid-like protein (TIGR03299 family)